MTEPVHSSRGQRGVPDSRPIIGRMFLGVTELLRSSHAVRLMRENEHWSRASREQIRVEQMRRLSRLLQHAESKVPYYREMFRSLGIRAQDVRSLEDYARLPILTKDIVRSRLKDLMAEGFGPKDLVRCNSGGSTGKPVTFYHDRLSYDASDAATYRNFRQVGWQPGEMIALMYCGGDKLSRMSKWEFEVRQSLRRIYQFDPSFGGPENWQKWLQRWPSLGITVALGYPSSLSTFAQYIETSGQSVAPLRGVFSSGEKLYPPQREIIGRVFQCPVLDCYGSSEVRNIAAECPRGRMHIQEDYAVVEIDRSGAVGEATPLIVTSLWNFGMPFLRYRNEDCGSLVDGACDCGSNFALMNLDIGRVNDNFLLPGGKVVHGQFFTWLMYGSQGIASFQFHQTAPDAITLWVVPTPDFSEAREKVIQRAIERIRGLSTEPIHVEVHEVENIPLTGSGKHRFTRSDVAVSVVPAGARD